MLLSQFIYHTGDGGPGAGGDVFGVLAVEPLHEVGGLTGLQVYDAAERAVYICDELKGFAFGLVGQLWQVFRWGFEERHRQVRFAAVFVLQVTKWLGIYYLLQVCFGADEHLSLKPEQAGQSFFGHAF